MRKWISLLMTLCASYSVASDSTFEFLAGYRHDNIDWNVQVPRCDPSLKVSSNYKNIDIFQLGIRGRTNLGCNFYTRASFDLGWILDGDLRDKTSLFDNDFSDECDVHVFEALTFETESVLDGRFVLDLDIAFGYPFYFCDCQAYIAPVVGYAFNEQYLTDDTNSRVAFGDSNSDNFAGHDCCTEKFISKWYGPFVGLDFKYDPCTCWNTYGSVEYHWVNAKIKRQGENGFCFSNDWNHHYNSSRGWVVNFGLAYEWCHCWSAGIDFVYRDFVAHRHHHECLGSLGFESEGSSSSSGFDSFKTKTTWRSYAISAIVERGF